MKIRNLKRIIQFSLSVLLTMFFIFSIVFIVGNNKIEASSDNVSNASTVIEISSASQLNTLIKNNTDSDFSGQEIKLTNNITISDSYSYALGGFENFSGIFDGQGYTITFPNTDTTTSFFGTVCSGAVVKNLKIKGRRIYIESGGLGNNIPTIIGTVVEHNNGTIESCIVENSYFWSDRYKTNCYTAGIVGMNYGNVRDCIVGDLYMASQGANLFSNPDGMYCSPFVARNEKGNVWGNKDASNCVFIGEFGYYGILSDEIKKHLIGCDVQGNNYKSLYDENISAYKERGPIDKCDSNWYEYESGYHYLRAFMTWVKYTIKPEKLDNNYGTVKLSKNNSNTDVETDDTGKIYYDYLPTKPESGEIVYLNNELTFCGDVYTAQDNTSGQYYFSNWSLSGTTYTATFDFNGETFIEFQTVSNATTSLSTKKYTVDAGVVITGERYSNTQYRFSWKYNNVSKTFTYTAKTNYTFPNNSNKTITTKYGKNSISPPTPEPKDLTLTFPKIANTKEDAETITIKYGSSIYIRCYEDYCLYSWNDGYGNRGSFSYTPVEYYSISNCSSLDGKSFSVTTGGNVSSTYRPTLKSYPSYTLSFQYAGFSDVDLYKVSTTTNGQTTTRITSYPSSVYVYKTSTLRIYTEYEGTYLRLCYNMTNTSGKEVTIYYQMPKDDFEIVDAGGDNWSTRGYYEILSSYSIKPNMRLSDTCDLIFKQNNCVEKYYGAYYPDITESDYTLSEIQQGNKIDVKLQKTGVEFDIEGYYYNLTFTGKSYTDENYYYDVSYYLKSVTINGKTFSESGTYSIPEKGYWYEINIYLNFEEPKSLVFYNNGYNTSGNKLEDITIRNTNNIDYNYHNNNSLNELMFVAHILYGTKVYYKQENNNLIYYWTDLDGEVNEVEYDVPLQYQLYDADWYNGSAAYNYETEIKPQFKVATYNVRINVQSACNVLDASDNYGVTPIKIPGIKNVSGKVWSSIEYGSNINVEQTSEGGRITAITISYGRNSFTYEAEEGYSFNGVNCQNKTNCKHADTPTDYICCNCDYIGSFIGEITIEGYTVIEVSVLKIGTATLVATDNATLFDMSGKEQTSISQTAYYYCALVYWDGATSTYVQQWQADYAYQVTDNNKTFVIKNFGKYVGKPYYQIETRYSENKVRLSLVEGYSFKPKFLFYAVHVTLSTNYEQAEFNVISKSSEIEISEEENLLKFIVENGAIVTFDIEGKDGFLTYTYTFANIQGEILKISYKTKDKKYCISKVEGVLQNGLDGENEYNFNSKNGEEKILDLIFGLKSYDTSLE